MSLIHQTIHGYSDGHRLLGSSCRIPREAERVLLLLSDLSGSSGGEQFDPYLTAYPVASTDFYAVARTWAAPEMGRPGCVWTHTLLLGPGIIARMKNPLALIPLFRRPSSEKGFGDYLEPVSAPEGIGEFWGMPAERFDLSRAIAADLIHALYANAESHVAFTVSRYDSAELPFLSVWRSQWPKLRASFTFCSGSRSARTLDGEVFRLQATLERDVRRVSRGNPNVSVVSEFTPESHREEWIQVAAEACADYSDTGLLAFMMRVGRGIPGNTAFFRPLVQAYLTLNHAPPARAIEELLDFVAEEFPRQSTGREFKWVFFGPSNSAELPEFAVIRGLAATEHHDAFDAELLEIRARAAALWASEQETWNLLRHLVAGQRTPLADEVLRGLCEAFPVHLLPAAVDTTPEGLVAIFRYNPSLAATSSIWDSRLPKQSRVAKALLGCRESIGAESDAIVKAALKAMADPTNPSLIDVFGASAIPSILSWLDADEDHPRDLLPGWRSEIVKYSAEMLGWLHERHFDVRRETMLFVLEMVDLPMVRSIPLIREVFTVLAGRTRSETDAAIMSFATKILIAALSMKVPESAGLAAIAIDSVYHAAAASRLPDDAWYELSVLLPRGYWWQDWDRCERLRKGIAAKFCNGDWPAVTLTEMTNDDAVLSGIATEIRNCRSGEKILDVAARSTEHRGRRDILLKKT